MAITKVFRVELVGSNEVVKRASQVAESYAKIAKEIAALKGQLSGKFASTADAQAVDGLKTKIAALEKQLVSLDRQRKTSENQVKSNAAAEKILADAKLRSAKADKEAELASKAKAQTRAIETKSIIDQEKELDRLIAKEEKAATQKKSTSFTLGSITDVRQQKSELNKAILPRVQGETVDFRGQLLGYDEAIAKLKQLTDTEAEFRRQFSKDGTLVGEYTSGIIKAFNDLKIDDIIKNQVNGSKEALNSLEKETNELVVAYRRAQQEGSEDLGKLEQKIHANVVETEQLRKAVQSAETQLKGFDGVGSQITQGIKSSFKEAKKDLAQFVLGYIGFQKLLSGIQSSVSNAAIISDQTTDLEIQLGGASGAADKLTDSLKNIDTRTTVQGLQEIADTALKAGATKENLESVTTAIDKTKIAFGKDFGSVEQGTETFAKLINIFFDDREITGERILGIGNSIRTLANETVASVPYITDFSGRMAGLRQIANITLPDVIGLGAGFEEFKQSAEVSSSALVKVIPALAKDVEQFSKIAGVTVDEFRKLINDNPVEALLKVSEGLVKGKGDIESVSKAFADAGLDAGRVTTILGTLGGKADVFRERIKLAGSSMNDSGAITDAFEKKNNNLAATIDKINKKFSDVAASRSFQLSLLAISSIVAFLLAYLPGIITLLALYGVGWLTVAKEVKVAGVATSVTNGQLLLQRAALIGNNILLGITRLYTIAAAVAQSSYNAAIALYTGITNRATVATLLFGNATRLLGLGAILTVIAVLVASFKAFGSTVAGTTEELRKLALQNQVTSEIQKKANADIAEQTSSLDRWISVINSSSASVDTKATALKKLIALSPEYLNGLTLENIKTKEGIELIAKYNESIRAKASAEAAASLSAEKQKNVRAISSIRQDLETQFGITKGAVRTIKGFTSEEIDTILNGIDQSQTSIRATDKGGIQFNERDINRIQGNLKRQEDEAIKIYSAYLDGQKVVDEQLIQIENKAQEAARKNAETVSKGFEIDIPYLKSQIEALDKKINEFRGARKDLLALENQRKKLQDQLDATQGKQGKAYTGSKLTGEQKDDLKDIDATLSTQRAKLEKARIDQTEFNGKLISDEKVYLTELLNINQTGIDAKLKLLKGKNAEERKQIAELNLEKTINLKETNQKLFDIDNADLERRLNLVEQSNARKLKISLSDPNLNETGKLRLQEVFYNQQLASQITFNVSQEQLEKKYKINSIKNADDRKAALEKIQDELNAIAVRKTQAGLTDALAAAETAAQNFQNEQRRIIANQVNKILSDDSITNKDKGSQIKKLEEGQAVIALRSDLERLQQILDAYKKFGHEKDEANKDFLAKEAEFAEKQKALTTLQNKQLSDDVFAKGSFVDKLKEFFKGVSISDNLKKLFDVKSYTKDADGERAKYEDAIAQTSNTVKQTINDAYQNYFANQVSRVEKDKTEHLNFLDREKQRVLATAKSEAEKDTIERQFEKKKEAIEKQASERKKQIALKEAAINFGVAIIKTFAQFGFPIGLIPAAALTIAYLLQRSQIQKQTFEKGGPVPGTGGIFKGARHHTGGIPFTHEAEDGEAYVINRNSTSFNKPLSVHGTPRQILSSINKLGGGVSFANGGVLRKLEKGGQMGTYVRAPTFNEGFYSSGVNNAAQASQDMQELKQMVADVTAAVYASDVKEVLLNPGKVTKAQDRTKKDVSLATI